MKIKETGAYRLARKIYYTTKNLTSSFVPELGTVFMLHRVGEWDDTHLLENENLKIPPSILRKIILSLSKTHDFIRAEDVPSRIQTQSKQKRPFVAFTFDDGYKDNLTCALPIFKELNVPFTIFVTSDFPNLKAILWWYILEDFMLQNDSIVLTNGASYKWNNKETRSIAFMEIRKKILELNQTNLLNELCALFSITKIDWQSESQKKADALCLSWKEIELLSKEPLVTIGGHTAHHLNLRELQNKNDVTKEVTTGKDMLSLHGIPPTIFAYPYGSKIEVSKREIDALSKTEYSAAFVAYNGKATQFNTKNNFALPRQVLGINEWKKIIGDNL